MNSMNRIEEWKAQMLVDGKTALQALLNGTASLGHLAAAEPYDVVDDVLGPTDVEAGVLGAFDQGCLTLAQEYRDNFLRDERAGNPADLLKLDMLLRIIRRMLPPKTVVDFHRRFVSWSGFFENFVVDEGLDLRREYYRILSISQDIAEYDGLDPMRLVPLWLSVCAGSGVSGLYDPTNLRIGLDGLRLLPTENPIIANSNPELVGLAYWAAWQRPTEEEFDLQWGLRRDYFKRPTGFTKEGVQAAIAIAERDLSERTGGEDTTFPIANWWLRDVGIDSARSKSLSPRRTDSAVGPVPKREWSKVLRSVGEPLDRVGPEIEKLMRRQRRYADQTGDFFFLVRTGCNFGMRLLERAPDSERVERGRLAASLAAQALGHDPADVFAWSLMRDALAASGRIADAELVGWESIRRFPENVQWRTQLASMLAVHAGKADEAEALLRETVELFPCEPHARALLATVLSDDLGRREEAFEALREAIGSGVADDASRRLMRKHEQGFALRGEGLRPKLVESDASFLEMPPGATRRQLFLFETGAIGEEAMREFLADNSADSYAVYVSERVGLTDIPVKSNFALAFEEALRRAEPSGLRELLSRARPPEKAIVEEALDATMEVDIEEAACVEKIGAALETRDARACARDREARGDLRFPALQRTLRQEGGRADRRIRLLRDFAASTLSGGCVVSLLAA